MNGGLKVWELMCNPQGHCPYVTSTEFVWEDEFVNLRIHRIQESFIGKQPVHPEKLTWNLKMTCLTREIIFQSLMFFGVPC